jgi:hypothetical protein
MITPRQQAINYYQRKSKTKYIGPLAMVGAYIDLGGNEKVLQWLDRASQDRSMGLYAIALSPAGDPVRGDPRFQNLLRRMNFPVDSTSVGKSNN